MGYTYPELANSPSNATLIGQVKALYAGPDDGTPAKTKRQESSVGLNHVYFAQIQMPKVGRPYSVYVFVGDVTGSAQDWPGLDSFVGLTSTLGGHSGDEHGLGSVDVTEALVKKIESGETTVEKAAEYLKKNLKWRLVFADAEIPRAELTEAEASLLSTEVERATSDTEFDRWVGGFQKHGVIDA